MSSGGEVFGLAVYDTLDDLLTTLGGKAQVYLKLPAIEAGMDDVIYI
ncbi:MAG TPA: hypothetical protein PKE64_29440 [Anaerolineae bacterium]|mgnify:CR=1 FL=1|nr:hypothetical protein [Anaerolineae bacterium]